MMNYSWTSIQWTCLVKIFRREFTVYTLQRNLVKLSSNLVGSIGWTWNRVFRVWRTHFICVAKIICWSSPFFFNLSFSHHILCLSVFLLWQKKVNMNVYCNSPSWESLSFSWIFVQFFSSIEPYLQFNIPTLWIEDSLGA